MDEQRLTSIVTEVLKQLRGAGAPPTSPTAVPLSPGGGVYASVDEAIAEAAKAQGELMALDLERREQLVEAVRRASLESADRLARMAYDETGLGRYEDKIGKNENAARLTPGTEDLASQVITAGRGTLLVEHGPIGVAVSITPVTNPTSTIINHAIGMLAAGNSCFFAPHPRGQACAIETLRVLNMAVAEAGGPENCLVAVTEATLPMVNEAMQHPSVRLVVATGGPGVVRAALASGKRAIAGGPGNPPVLVDETADLRQAAAAIVAGATLDNNLLCVAEKTVIVVDAVASRFLDLLLEQPVLELRGADVQRLTDLVVKDGHMNPAYIGKGADVILGGLGASSVTDLRAIVVQVESTHPLVQLEQLMPVIPVVRVRDFEQGLKLAVEVEHGNRHTAIIHSHHMGRVTRYGRAIRPTLLVCNAPSYAGLGVDGVGPITLTVAGPTGEGIVTARHFTRQNRLHLGGGALTLVAGS
jgi:propionaldehyde dehydrogenase